MPTETVTLEGNTCADNTLLLTWRAVLSNEVVVDGLQSWSVRACRFVPQVQTYDFGVLTETGANTDQVVIAILENLVEVSHE